MSLVARVIVRSTREKKDAALDGEAIKLFMRKLRDDKPLVHSIEGSDVWRQELVESLQAAYDLMQSKLREVKIFAGLSNEEIETLQSSMTSVPFRRGQDVITQGDDGDTFYVITAGEAQVVRINDEDIQANLLQVIEHKLADLHAYDYFGERALLKREPRMATVRATTDLETMCISGRRFEQATRRGVATCFAVHILSVPDGASGGDGAGRSVRRRVSRERQSDADRQASERARETGRGAPKPIPHRELITARSTPNALGTSETSRICVCVSRA
eukprot:395742-Prymnesium_polylepis.1